MQDVVPIELTSSEPKECQEINMNAIQNTSTTNATNISQSNGLYQTVVANNQIQELASEPPTINTDFNSNSLSSDSPLISPGSLQYLVADLFASIEANNTYHRKRKLQDMPQNTGTHTKLMAIECQSYDRSNRKDGSVNHGAQLKTTITKGLTQKAYNRKGLKPKRSKPQKA
ncbi:unnamed protein product [Oppiella nova]|uniref:Uncharacterized protein n=1 Tax=Oppiella nova TaxID=334625 RepID=A0A7R9LLI5_9ACAR|nr:unnamed protein product [Oppiella nova]CAG2164729.1 unnamed protein product [Oppiella nova]